MSVQLRLLDELAAAAMAAGETPSSVRGAAGFPAESDRIAALLFVERCGAGLDPRPFGHFLVCLVDEAAGPPPTPLAIGGIGFHGGPDEQGQVEIGYGIVPAYRGRGHASKALRLLVDRAVCLGARCLTAETEADNLASQHVLEGQGFRLEGQAFSRQSARGDTVFYQRRLLPRAAGQLTVSDGTQA